MSGSIVILEPPDAQFGEVRRAFRAVAAPDWEVRLVSSGGELLQAIADPACPHLAIVPDVAGDDPDSSAQLIARIHRVQADIPVVVAAKDGSVDAVSRAIGAGANDFLVLGERLRERAATLLGKLRGLFEVIDRNRLLDEQNARLRETLQRRFKIVGESPQMRRLIDQIRRVSGVPRPLLIVGERGTGKEQVARAIHFTAGLGDRPMVTVNCAAFSDTLLETELFGHEKGAFTGADRVGRGRFEQADGGTLFLDEISHMSLPFQQKILRVVEYGTFTRVGGTAELATRARIIAATNSDLTQKIEKDEFLADLYDRLSFEVIEVPPLREREGDVEVLANHFLDEFAREIPAFRGKALAGTAIDALNRYTFPGNVRELKNIIERAAYRDTTNEITPQDIGLLPESPIGPARTGGFHEQVRAFSERLLSEAMREASGNQAEAARILGLSYHQFRYHYRKYLR